MKVLLKPAFLVLAILASLVVAKTVSSDECGQLGSYQNCPRGEVMLDKLVYNPVSKTYVDNLDTPRFLATQEVVYRLTVKNSSNVVLANVDVVDKLPQEVEYVSGPQGATYNKDTKEIRFVVKDLAAGEARDFEIKGKVVSADRFPADKDWLCVVNEAEAKIPENTDSDTSRVCIAKPPVPSLPKTGPAETLLLMSSAVAAAGVGVQLMRRAKFESGKSI